MPEENTEALKCPECNNVVRDDDRYCYNCGNYLGTQAVTINIFNNADLRAVFVFYFIYLFICLLIKHTDLFNSYDQLFWVELLLAVVTLNYVYKNWSQVKPVLRFNNFKTTILLGIIVLGVVGSVLVSVFATELNVTFFHTNVSYYDSYKLYRYPVVVMLYSIALTPAIFEELAFRGVMYNYCNNFLDERLVVAVTAFLFAIMHLSLISLVWLLPFAFFIGNLRRRYNTLWYGIIFHFVFNLTACFFDLYKQGKL